MNIRSFMGVKSLRGFIYPILIVILLSAVSLRLSIRDQKSCAEWSDHWKSCNLTTLLWAEAVKTAVWEEIIFRGPAYAFLIAALFTSWYMKRAWGKEQEAAMREGRIPVHPALAQDGIFLTARRVDGVPIHDIIAGILAIAGTYVWAAKDHPYPLPTFAMGLIFVYVMLKTRNILWSIAVHAFMNACAIISVKYLGISMLY